MRSTHRESHHAEAGGPSGSIGSVVPKVLVVLAAVAVLRSVLGGARRHRGPSAWSRRRQAIAEFHRELHAEDAAAENAA